MKLKEDHDSNFHVNVSIFRNTNFIHHRFSKHFGLIFKVFKLFAVIAIFGILLLVQDISTWQVLLSGF